MSYRFTRQRKNALRTIWHNNHLSKWHFPRLHGEPLIVRRNRNGKALS